MIGTLFFKLSHLEKAGKYFSIFLRSAHLPLYDMRWMGKNAHDPYSYKRNELNIKTNHKPKREN